MLIGVVIILVLEEEVFFFREINVMEINGMSPGVSKTVLELSMWPFNKILIQVFNSFQRRELSAR